MHMKQYVLKHYYCLGIFFQDTRMLSSVNCEEAPGENTPQLAVAQNDLNAGRHYQSPLYRPHGLEEPLLNNK